MRGLNLFEEAHLVNAIPPIDGTGGKNSDVWTMKNARCANIILQVGVSAAAFTKIKLQACSNFAGDDAEDLPFRLYKEETAAGDTLTGQEAVTAAGYTPSANDNIMYGIFLDAAELPDGKPFARVATTNGSNSVIMSCLVILTGTGYRGSALGISAIA